MAPFLANSNKQSFSIYSSWFLICCASSKSSTEHLAIFLKEFSRTSDLNSVTISNEYKYYIWICVLGSQAHTICTIIFPSRLPDLSWLVEMSQSFMIHGQIIKLNEEEMCTWCNLTRPYDLYYVLYLCPLFNHIRIVGIPQLPCTSIHLLFYDIPMQQIFNLYNFLSVCYRAINYVI